MDHQQGGIALGNAIVAARSAAAFYSAYSKADEWVLTFIRDILSSDDPLSRGGLYRYIHRRFPNWAKAVRKFCNGSIGTVRFCWLADHSALPHANNREARELGHPHYDNREDIRYSNNPAGDDKGGRTWTYAVRHIAAVANDAYDNEDLKIEFERVYELDTLSGGGPLSATGFRHPAVAAAESVKAIAKFGFLNRAAVFGVKDGGVPSDRVHYKSYMFGSDVIILDNDLANYGSLDASMPPGTDKRHLQRALDMNDVELKRFISNIVTVSGGIMSADGSRVVDRKAKRRRRGLYYNFNNDYDTDGNSDEDNDNNMNIPYEGCVKFTSFNKLNNSLQFTFNTQASRLYFSANVLLLKADDFCTNDLVYRRAAVSSLCQCDRPVLAWRACVLVTPINCATIEGNARVEVTKVVMAAFTAFRAVYKNKKSTSDTRLATISAFLAMPIPPFITKSVRPIRDATEANGRPSLVKLCVFHRWLRAHSGSEWLTCSMPDGVEPLIKLIEAYGGRAVIIQRPILMTGTGSESAGKRSFLRFMTYEDSVKKLLRLTKHSLMNGLSDSGVDGNCAVAYVRGKNDLIVFHRADSNFVSEDEGSLVERERSEVKGPARLWQSLFKAPTCLYIDLSVLVSMGFNVVAIERGGRYFQHRDSSTQNICTVFCSVLMRIVEDPACRVLNIQDDDITSADQNAYTAYTEKAETLRGVDALVGHDSRFNSSTQTRPQTINNNNNNNISVHSRIRESVYNINDYWPGVDLIKTDFVDPELEHVCFVYFVGNGASRMTLERLHAFSNYSSRQAILPPPILFTIQRMVLKELYM